MESRSEDSPSVPAQGPRLHCFGRGGLPSMVRAGSKDHAGTAQGAPRPSTAGPHVSDLVARPKRPWDNATTLDTATTATTFLSQQHTAPGTATAAGAGAGAGAEETVEEGEERAANMTGRAHGPRVTEGARGASSKSDLIDADRCDAASGTTSSASVGFAATKATADDPTVVASSSLSSSSSAASALRTGGAFSGDGDLTDSDESVMARLAEFTELARRTAIQNEDLSRELAAEKRRVTHTNRKLEQCNSTCTELRESLALAQDTVMKLREHEMKWAESTASEMSFRAEVCALKDEYSSASGEAAALKKRCVALERENAELGERFATIAEEKRQVESRARRLLRSDRYRGY